jgi:hypothetical protein
MKTVRQCLGLACACAIALFAGQAQAAASLSFDGNAKLANNRLAVTVTGSYSCGLDQYGQQEAIAIVVSVKQAAGKSIAFGYGTVAPVCDGTQKQFSVVIVAQGGDSPPFHGGPARADATIYVTSGYDINVGQNISLTGNGK